MARTRQLSDLRNDAYKLADVENDTARFPNADVNELINQGIARVYDMLISGGGAGAYYEKPATITTDGINTTYVLPADFLRLQHIQVNLSNTAGTNGDTNQGLEPYLLSELPLLSSSSPAWIGQPFAYRIRGGSSSITNSTQGTIPTQYAIDLRPLPAANMLVSIWYIPSCPRLVNDTDTFDGIDGYELYAVAHAAKWMRYKDDLPVDHLLQLQKELKERIDSMAPHRDARPQRVTDVRRTWRNKHYRRWRIG